MNIILRRPIISEKSMKLAGNGLYTFMVERGVTKPQIAKAVGSQFKVDVLGVRTFNVKGEKKLQRKVRKSYQTAGWKKALVQLKKGQRIAIFEVAPEGSASAKASADKEAVVTTAEGEPQILKEKKDILRRTRIKVEKGAPGAAPTTQRKVITGK